MISSAQFFIAVTNDFVRRLWEANAVGSVSLTNFNEEEYFEPGTWFH
jgi:hypothetical protein